MYHCTASTLKLSTPPTIKIEAKMLKHHFKLNYLIIKLSLNMDSKNWGALSRTPRLVLWKFTKSSQILVYITTKWKNGHTDTPLNLRYNSSKIKQNIQQGGETKAFLDSTQSEHWQHTTIMCSLLPNSQQHVNVVWRRIHNKFLISKVQLSLNLCLVI